MGEIISTTQGALASRALAFCSFRAGERLCGIDVLHVREVSTQVSSTPVPQAPVIIRGLVNLRSRIHLVADLRPIFGMAPVECTPDSRLVILKENLGEGLGVLVDQVGDIVRVSPEQIEISPDDVAQSGRIAHVVHGVCKLENELMIIVDPVKLIAFIEAAIE